MPSILRDRAAVTAAAQEAQSYADLCIRLGLSRRGANIARAKAACREAGIPELPNARRAERVGPPVEPKADPRTRRGVFADRKRVAAAAAGASTYMEIIRRLGVAATATNYRRLEVAARESGINLPRLRPNGPGQARGPLYARRRSAVWNAEALRRAVDGAQSMADVLRRLGIPPRNTRLLQLAADHFGTPLPRGNPGKASRQRAQGRLIEQLVENGRFISGQRLRTCLVEAGLLKDECTACGIGPEWNGRSLVLQLDHINGVATDNRLINLRLLCPNCHSQTETFAGRNLRSNPVGNGVTGNTPGFDPGDGLARAGSNPASPAKPR